MKKRTYFGTAILIMLSLILLVPSAVSATGNDINVAEKSCENFVNNVGIEAFPQWQGSTITDGITLFDLQGNEMGYLFNIYKAGKVLGKIVVGNSLYNYNVLEANDGNPITMPSDADAKTVLNSKLGLAAGIVNKPKLYYLGVNQFYAIYSIGNKQAGLDVRTKIPYLLSELKSGIATPEQYKKSQASSNSLAIRLLNSNYLQVPIRNMADTCIPTSYRNNNNCGPTSGAMIAEFWRLYCPSLPNWCTDHNELYVTMQCNTWGGPGVLPANFASGFVQYASNHGYSFSSSVTLANDSYSDIQNQIDAGHPLGVMFTINGETPNLHWNALRGYNINNGVHQIYTNDAWGSSGYVNWDSVGWNSSIVRLWKN